MTSPQHVNGMDRTGCNSAGSSFSETSLLSDPPANTTVLQRASTWIKGLQRRRITNSIAQRELGSHSHTSVIFDYSYKTTSLNSSASLASIGISTSLDQNNDEYKSVTNSEIASNKDSSPSLSSEDIGRPRCMDEVAWRQPESSSVIPLSPNIFPVDPSSQIAQSNSKANLISTEMTTSPVQDNDEPETIINSETSLIEVIDFLAKPPPGKYVLVGKKYDDGIRLKWEKSKSSRFGKIFIGEKEKKGMYIAFEALEKFWDKQCRDIQTIHDFWDSPNLDQILNDSHEGKSFIEKMEISRINREEAIKATKKFQKKQNTTIKTLKFESNFRKTNPEFVKKIIRKLGIIAQLNTNKYEDIKPFIDNSPENHKVSEKNNSPEIYEVTGKKLDKNHIYIKWKKYKKYVSERDNEKHDERRLLTKEALSILIKYSVKYKQRTLIADFSLTKENIENFMVEEKVEEKKESPEHQKSLTDEQTGRVPLQDMDKPDWMPIWITEKNLDFVRKKVFKI